MTPLELGDRIFALINPLAAFAAGVAMAKSMIVIERHANPQRRERWAGWALTTVMFWIATWLGVQVFYPTFTGMTLVDPIVGAVALRPTFVVLYLFVAWQFHEEANRTKRLVSRVAEEAARRVVEGGTDEDGTR